MKKKILLCIPVLLALGLVLALWGRGNAPEKPAPTTEVTTPATEDTVATEGTDMGEQTIPSGETVPPTHETEQEAPATPGLPQTLPPVVELPVETDPATGESKGVTFPAAVEGYELVIEKLAPYDGMFVEDGSNAQVQGVAMLLLKNAGDYPVEYAEITVEYEHVTLTFAVTALPVGQRLVVQERGGQPVPEGTVVACRAMVVQRAELSISPQVQVTDNGNDSITVKNLTGQMLPTVRVFYKYYMADQELFIGGIAFTVRVTRLAPGSSVTLRPSHYTSAAGKVVMVLTYDQEV